MWPFKKKKDIQTIIVSSIRTNDGTLYKPDATWTVDGQVIHICGEVLISKGEIIASYEQSTGTFVNV